MPVPPEVSPCMLQYWSAHCRTLQQGRLPEYFWPVCKVQSCTRIFHDCRRFRFALHVALPCQFYIVILKCKTAVGLLNDVYVNGQGQDVLCRSNQIITDANMYITGSILNDLLTESCNYFDLVSNLYWVGNGVTCDINEDIGAMSSISPDSLIVICMCSD